METIQSFFRQKKRATAFFLAGAIAVMSFLPKIVSAFNLNAGYYTYPESTCTWGDNSEAMNCNNEYYNGSYTQTGLAFNQAFYTFDKMFLPPDAAAGIGNRGWPLGAQFYLQARPGYEKEEYAMFNGRHTYCSGSHESARPIAASAQAFTNPKEGFRLPANPFPEATIEKTNPDFNFLMLALGCYYPGEYKVPADIEWCYEDPWAAMGMASQLIAWMATDKDEHGFTGVPQGADAAAVNVAFLQDLDYFRSKWYYTKSLPTVVTPELAPDLYNGLFTAPDAGSGAAKAGMTTKLDGYFYDIWWAAYFTSLLEPDWDKGITKAKAVEEQKDGEYHAYLDLFVNDSAGLYLSGISFEPYGDWEYLGIDGESGKQHFKSASGELDENGSIGKLYWPKGTLGSFMPVDLTKAKLYTFDTYNQYANPADFGKTQTQFASWCDGDLNIFVTIGDDSGSSGESSVKCERFEHTEQFTATYNVSLLKYDSETGKPLAGSHWDILEKFDNTQLGNTDLDRTPDAPGTYETGLGNLNQTEWGNDEISSNYSGSLGVTQSDTNKYNWGNDGGPQFEEWDDPYRDPCKRDDNITGEDGLLYEIDSAGEITEDPAHTDTKGYTYHKGYCTGHPAPEIEYLECECEEECDCEEMNQQLHDEAWAAWYEEVKKCEKLVEEGGFFHCTEPGDAAKEAMEADRDQFYKDFISLTYEYSASEIQAAKGYILHGLHTDDIPVEWRTVTSSEYKDTGEAQNLNHTGGGAPGTDPDDGEEPGGDDGEEEPSRAYRSTPAIKRTRAALPRRQGAGEGILAAPVGNAGAAQDGNPDSAPETESTDGSLHETDTLDEDGSNDETSGTTTAKNQDQGGEETMPGADIIVTAQGKKVRGTGIIPEAGNPDETEDTAKAEEAETSAADEPLTADEPHIADKTGSQIRMESVAADNTEFTEHAGDTDKGGSGSGAGDGNGHMEKNGIPGWLSHLLPGGEKEPAGQEAEEALNDEEEGLYLDYDLLPEDGIRYAPATSSDAARRAPAERVGTGYANGGRRASSISDDGDGGEGGGSYLRNSTAFLQSKAGQVARPDGTLADWTFVVYDHRTEGEIHFNKRDFDLADDGGALFDAYAQENSDGTLEGAVYGLFAAQDIIHPDTDGDGEGDTGVVFQKNDLVAVATTDRNGDGSFMAITEAPGSVYNYETGSIEHTGWHGEAPGNLHMAREASAAKEQDMEHFAGHNPDGSKITAGDGADLPETREGDSTVHYKKSTNQGYDSGMLGHNRVTNNKTDTWQEGETTGHYPVSNNEENNGNGWIGRPLILGKDGSSYYIRELSRSEGYELSVYGKDSALITNREAFKAGGEDFPTGTAVSTALSYDRGDGGTTTFMITSKGTENGYIVKASDIPEGAVFNITSVESVWDDSVTHPETVQTKEPVYAEEGELVVIGNRTWEAGIGDTVEYNGRTFTVNNVKTVSYGKQKAAPDNSMRIENANLNPSQITAGGDVINDVNRMFLKSGFRKAADGAPWASVEIEAFTAEAVAEAVNAQLFTDSFYQAFNAMQMAGAYESGGKLYAAIAYCCRDAKPNESLYNEANDSIYVKTAITYRTGPGDETEGFVYRVYPASQCDSVMRSETGFVTSAIVPNETAHGKPEYAGSRLEDQVEFRPREDKTFWAYAAGEPLLQADGTDAVRIVSTVVDKSPTLVQNITNTEIACDSYQETRKGAGTYTFAISQEMLDALEDGTIQFRITYKDKIMDIDGTKYTAGQYAAEHGAIGITFPIGSADSYIEPVFLMYPGDRETAQDGGTAGEPVRVFERPIRQKVRIEKDIQTLAETKVVWYCLNCGYENPDGETACGFCGRARSTEETKHISYAHDTYAAFHSDNISAERDGGWYETAKDWLGSLLKGDSPEEEPESIGNFRFKAYLKSNLERLYRDEDGHVVWMDRNGNTMAPQYEDTNGDGNYDTFTWKYDSAYGGKTVDFPEKDKVSEEGTLSSSNVQKIYTDVEHRPESMTTSARANNLWDTYADPQQGNRENAGEIEGYTTSEREVRAEGDAVVANASLYSYDGVATDRDRHDHLEDEQNHGYARLLETRRCQTGDGAELINHEEYNYEKFFDAIQAANTDIWDDDMRSTFTGDAMSNYPGQHWFETFYEKYQKDDADPGHTQENTDGADRDNTAGGDRDTSFKPFRWIREHVFGDRPGYEKYQAMRLGENTETAANTSDFARANAQASDAVRQFAVKWYLEDEAAKLMMDNGLGENIAKPDGKIGYDEAVYDLALFAAVAKAYNYLRPFYYYDLDTIYSVEWDSAAGGGADKDYTTLSADERLDGRYYNISAYLPYGVYVIVEQTPQRRDGEVNDWKNRSFGTGKPKEVTVPSVYDGPGSNDTTDNYDPHYTFDAGMPLTGQAKSSGYLIRFGEEDSDNTPNQDSREFVIRAHGCHGDFEVYKYGLDIDHLQASVAAPNGDYHYGGWDTAQEIHDPLKDYYGLDHRGGEGVVEIQKENGGNDASRYHGSGPDVTENGNGAATANGSNYDGEALRKRYFYASIAEDDGIAGQVLFKDRAVDGNNAPGMSWHSGVKSTTGELTAYDGKYSAALAPWTMTAPADSHVYNAQEFSGYADVNQRNHFYTAMLRINKTDSETGEYIVHDDAIFGLYAASRYNTFAEIEGDAKLIGDPDERARFLMQFRPGDAKFYLQDTEIVGSREFLEAMKARDITPFKRRTALNESMEDPGHLYSGIVPRGTPVCIESGRVSLYDGQGGRTGQMTVWTTRADVEMADPGTQGSLEYGGQNVGYFKTSQPIGAGVYVLAELKPPLGYVRSKPVAIEVYSDQTTYYADGDMYAKVAAVRYQEGLPDE